MRLAICDDEENDRRELRDTVLTYLARRNLEGSVTLFEDSRSLLENPDWNVVFLDINMPGINGMDAARKLRDMQSSSRVVFTTALQDYVYDAFSVEAADYLLKPVSYDKVARTMDRLLRPQAGKRIQLRHEGGLEIVPVETIEYCEVQGRTLHVRLADGRTLACNGKLRELEANLDETFFRCHRSYIVNLARVAACAKEEVRTCGGCRVPVSRLREKDLKEALMRFLSGDV